MNGNGIWLVSVEFEEPYGTALATFSCNMFGQQQCSQSRSFYPAVRIADRLVGFTSPSATGKYDSEEDGLIPCILLCQICVIV